MRSLLVTMVAALAVALPASAARSSFSGDACALIAAKQVAAVVGDTNAGKYECIAHKAIKTPAGITYQAAAGPTKPAAGGFLSVMVVEYASPKLEGVVQAQYAQSMKPLAHVGDWAYIHSAPSPVAGGTAAIEQLAFGAHGYGVVIVVRAKLAKAVDQTKLKSLAAAIVHVL